MESITNRFISTWGAEEAEEAEKVEEAEPA